jgi:hypothetical protein
MFGGLERNNASEKLEMKSDRLDQKETGTKGAL